MNTTELNTDKLVADLKRVVRDSEELLHATAEVVGEKAHELRGRLTDTLASAKETCHRVEKKTTECAKATDQTIRSHPYETVGVAFGVGLLIGALVSRR